MLFKEGSLNVKATEVRSMYLGVTLTLKGFEPPTAIIITLHTQTVATLEQRASPWSFYGLMCFTLRSLVLKEYITFP